MPARIRAGYYGEILDFCQLSSYNGTERTIALLRYGGMMVVALAGYSRNDRLQ